MKSCTKCLIQKDIAEFYSYGKWCKDCCKKQSHENYVKTTKNLPKQRLHYNSLSDETKNSIAHDISQKIPKAQIAQKNGIRYATLDIWIKNNKF